MSKEIPTAIVKRDPRHAVVSYVREECFKRLRRMGSEGNPSTSASPTLPPNPKCLNDMLDTHLDPSKPIDDFENIQLLKWLMSGGPEFDLFAKKVREYDASVMCGLVWTTNFVAYRCRTCAISPCMSLCADCFLTGNHEGHDYNMFRSQAGGACDCGDANVMNSAGFCPRHGPDVQQTAPTPPPELLAVAQAMLPRIFMRLIFYFRDTSDPELASYSMNQSESENFVSFLQSLSDMGAAMRRIMTLALLDTEQYRTLQQGEVIGQSGYFERSQQKFEHAFYNLELSGNSSQIPIYEDQYFKQPSQYQMMLDEIVFWMVKCEFPQGMVTLLLGLLPDEIYKEAFTVAFVRHYNKITRVLTLATDSAIRSTIANRVVHISVQLFSNEGLAFRMVTEHHILNSVIDSLVFMLTPILVPSTILGGPLSRHQVVECEKAVMKEHCYWPVVSDIINLLSHGTVAHNFLQQPNLCSQWMGLLTCLQGTNLNVRELYQHVEYEPDTYYAAFSAELEISASPMWSLINHCGTADGKEYVASLLKTTLHSLEKWFQAIDFKSGSKPHDGQLTFHLPLHRYLAAFLMLAVQSHDFSLQSLLPHQDTVIRIMMHPLQIQVCMPQIYAGMWVRNGIQIKGQAMTYIQCHFCYSMADLDIFLLQVCATSLQPDHYLELVFDRFQLNKWLSFEYDHLAAATDPDMMTDFTMLEGCLTFLCSLIGLRTYLGISEEEMIQREMAALLCMNDRQYSQLSELMPERSGMSSSSKDLFEPMLKKLADFKAPSFEAGVGLNQGSYTPKGSVWEEDFDPVMVAHRSIYRKDFQAAMDRYTAYVRSTGAYKGKNTPWPPYKMPGRVHPAYSKLYSILNSPTMHAFLYTILYKAVFEVPTMPDSILYKTIHLLDLCLHFGPKTFPNLTPSVKSLVKDLDYRAWFRTGDVKANACEVLNRVLLSEGSSPDIGHIDLSNSSLEEMFDIQPSVLTSPSGPITAAHSGQFPSVSMPSGSGSHSYTAVAPSPQPVLSSPETVKPKYQSRGVSTTSKVQGCQEKTLGESIISLLVKLHDKLSFPATGYKPKPVTASAKVSVGDGAFYISKFLDHLCASSSTAAKYVQSTCNMLHRKNEESTVDPDKADTRKKAISRQQKLMAKFASKQKAFMAQAQEEIDTEKEEEMNSSTELDGASSCPTGEQYDCVICNQTASSLPSKPIGIVVFLQATSILGHRQHTEVQESITSAPTPEQQEAMHCGSIMRRRHLDLLKHFEETTCALSVNIGWDGGVFVTTCGHFMHLDCHKAYLETLKTQQQTETISIARGEFFCPMCRQISNCVLPVLPEEEAMSVAKPKSTEPRIMANDIAQMMFQVPKQADMQEVVHATRSTIDAVYSTTYKPFHVFPYHDAQASTFLFVSSVARTNLELELMFRGGNLTQPLSPAIVKRLCLSTLLDVLALYCKTNAPLRLMLSSIWSHVTGIPACPADKDSNSLFPFQWKVPLLIRDQTALLVQLTLSLPPSAQIEHYLFIVQRLYCVTYIQALAVLSCRLTRDERTAWCKKGVAGAINSLEKWLFVIIGHLKSSPLYDEVDGSETFLAICQSVWSPHSAEASVQEFCLPFLRIAAVICQHKFGMQIPKIQGVSEFEALVTYLSLTPAAPSSTRKVELTSASCLLWAVPDPLVLVQAWCQEVSNLAKTKASVCKLLLNIDDKWAQPHLMALPESYYEIFRMYRHQQCSRCNSNPKDPALCLICGAFLCFRDNCCVDSSISSAVYECVSHSIQCGGGTGIYLLVNSSIIVVLRGARATLWGSVYLDQHGEEDRDLKRGKPLFLSQERLCLLESQWLGHSFDQSCKRWIWHRDRL